jgi:hypothetical protein
LGRPEAYSKADIDPQSKKPLDVGITGQEKPGNAKKNGGMLENGILKALESDHRSSGNALEVKAIGNGHCHCKSSPSRAKINVDVGA